MRSACRADIDHGGNLRHRKAVGRASHPDRARAFRPDPVRAARDARPGPPIYQKTAAYGHFGRKEEEFSWERTDKAEVLAAELKAARAA